MNKKQTGCSSRMLMVLSAAVVMACGCSNETTSEEKLVCENGSLCGGVCCEYECNDNVCAFPSTPASGENDCKEGQSFCAGKCVSFSSDPMHCGDCDTACKPGESCQSGSCVFGCADGLTLVETGLCVNPNIDSEHCGSDNIACADNMYCTEGSCKCMSGYYDCDGDASNGCEADVSCDYVCPGSDHSCGANLCCKESESCCGSSCCAEGTTCCGTDTCLDLKNDVKNCGACNNACNADQVCEDGECKASTLECTEGQKSCWGSCIDVMSDAKNCGGCDVSCEENQICAEGACTLNCAEGQIICNDKCVDPASDNFNCGECDNECSPEEMCTLVDVTETNDAGEEVTVQKNGCKTTTSISGKEDFTCECAEGDDTCEPKTACWGSCFDLQTDVNNCGACGNACDEGLSCVEGACTLVCADALTPCDTKCVDVQTNYANCGACGNACETSQICSAGECVDATISCEDDPKNKTLCWGVCVDISSENNNCGACGHVCDEGTECYNGTCIEKDETSECPIGQSMCFGACKDLHNDPDNCGACLNKCGEKYTCSDSKCDMVCTDSEIKCGDSCFDPLTSVKNCGGCGNVCLAGQECRSIVTEDSSLSAACQCDAGHFDCDGDASNGCESTTACVCTPGSKQACWRGTAETRHVGACTDGEQTCDASGMFWGACKGGVYPSATTCNDAGIYIGGDQNCNKIPDEQEECKTSCDLMRSADSYIGCEYWPVYLPNLPGENVNYKNHTILVSNPNNVNATIYIYRPENYHSSTVMSPAPFIQKNVAPGTVEIIQLSTKLDYMVDPTWTYKSPSTLDSKSYLLRSSHPVTVYQYNPWEGSMTYSADASLLLPANVFGQKYMIMNWAPNDSRFSANMTIVAVESGDTKVTVQTKAKISEGTGITAMDVNGTQTFNLSRFQVLNLSTYDTSAANREQTGSLITSDKKVAVYAGMKCSQIPHGYTACDHLEEMLFPIQAWGKSYFAVPVEQRGNSDDIWRIVAYEDNTMVTVPSSVGGPFTLNAGQFKEIITSEVFEILADRPISVGQFMAGQDYKKAGKGDPAFGMDVPHEQYRKDYYFSVPSSYSENYVTIIVPNDGTLNLDGVSLSTSDFKAIGTSGFKYKYLKISAGTHNMTGSKEFGLIGYGYSPYISYLYPIGLDLKKINNTN